MKTALYIKYFSDVLNSSLKTRTHLPSLTDVYTRYDYYYFLIVTPHVQPLTDLEQLRVHAVEVADKENSGRPSDIEKQQIASREVQHETSAMDHHQTD